MQNVPFSMMAAADRLSWWTQISTVGCSPSADIDDIADTLHDARRAGEEAAIDGVGIDPEARVEGVEPQRFGHRHHGERYRLRVQGTPPVEPLVRRVLTDALTDLQRQGIKTAIVSSDSEASVRQVLGPAAATITRFDCGAAVFGKHWKFRRVARRLGTEPADTICIGDEIRDIEAARAAGIDSGAVAWGYALLSALQAAGPTHLFNSIEEMMQRLTMTK